MAITRNSGRMAKRAAMDKINKTNSKVPFTALKVISGKYNCKTDTRRKFRKPSQSPMMQKKPARLTYRKLTLGVMDEDCNRDRIGDETKRKVYYSVYNIQKRIHNKFPKMCLNDRAIRKSVHNLHTEGVLARKKLSFCKKTIPTTTSKKRRSTDSSFTTPPTKRSRSSAAVSSTPNNSSLSTPTSIPDPASIVRTNGVSAPSSTSPSRGVSVATDNHTVIKAYGLPVGCSVHMPYNVRLNLVDESRNMNKFMRLQVVKAPTSDDDYYFVSQWGRNGTRGNSVANGPFTLSEAAAAMEGKFQGKTGTDWADRDRVGGSDSSARGGHGRYEVVRQRLRENNARVPTDNKKGSVAVSLIWDHADDDGKRNDLDLWVTTPSGERVGYSHRRSVCGGELDVDRQQGASEPVENIVWTDKAPVGEYRVQVHNYSSNHQGTMPFSVMIVKDGKGESHEMIHKVMPVAAKTWVDVKTFEYK